MENHPPGMAAVLGSTISLGTVPAADTDIFSGFAMLVTE
jgi:hypothetical protein